MFDRKKFIWAFSLLGRELERLATLLHAGGDGADEQEFLQLCCMANEENLFFSRFMQATALRKIAENYLTEQSLNTLLSYSDRPKSFSDFEGDYEAETKAGENALRIRMADKTVGIIMAGNIPAVGFHELLSALSTGAKVRVKLSSKDGYIIPAIIKVLASIAPDIASRVVFESPVAETFLHGKSWPFFIDRKIDFLLFSGSDSVKVMIQEEFPGVSILARGERFSFSVLTGKETDRELEFLAEDMFLYCGLGCRSSSYLFVPEEFNLSRIADASKSIGEYIKEILPWTNSYNRLRAMAAMEDRLMPNSYFLAKDVPDGQFVDGGFFLLENSALPFPPLGSVRFTAYNTEADIESFCQTYRDKIQKKYTNFGFAQAPATDDWMDGVNTVQAILAGCLKNKSFENNGCNFKI